MIIKRIKLDNWRAIPSRELCFDRGLNVLLGANEQGKSTIVEAIEKAFYWDHTQRKRKEDNLENIVPNSSPTARPTVELEVDFSDQHVVITKVVADQSKDRDCVLKIWRDGAAEQVFRGADAERKLDELLSAGKSAIQLGLSRQGHCYSYLSDALPPIAIAALTVRSDGAVLVSPRLDVIRATLGQRRKEQLIASIKSDNPLCAYAKAATDAARLWNERAEKVSQREAAQKRLAEVEQLRRDVLGLDRQASALAPQINVARTNLEKQREQQRLQRNADKERLAKQSAAQQLERQVNALAAQAAELVRLHSEFATVSQNRDAVAAEAVELDGQCKKVRRDHAVAQEQYSRLDGALSLLRKRCDAFVAQRSLLHQQHALERVTNNLSRVERREVELGDAKRHLTDLGSWPTGVQIGQWRREFNTLAALQRDALTKLQVNLELSRDCRVQWSADGGEVASCQVAAGTSTTIGAVCSLRLEIDGVGKLYVNCGAAELVELLRQIDAKSTRLQSSISQYGIAVGGLPDAFDVLEEKRIAGEEAERAVKAAMQSLKQAEDEFGASKQLREQLAASKKELSAAQVSAIAYQSLVTVEFSPEQLAAEVELLRTQIQLQENEVESARQAREHAAGELRRVETETARCQERHSHFKTRVAEIEAQQNKLRADGRTDQKREQSLNELRVELAGAQQQVNEADGAAAALGQSITDIELSSLDSQLQQMQARIGQLQTKAAMARGQIRTFCGDDPQGELEQLDEQVRQLDIRLQEEERSLAALLFLSEVLTEEHQEMARLMADPLNRRISPWLRQIRGVETIVVFDPLTSRITHVVSQRGNCREELPFSELSEGAKGQIGVLVRLALAREIARQNNGPHLVVLDDPLTDTSPDRRPEMFRVIAAAADDLQILFVTCHADVLATLPGQWHLIDLAS